MGDRNYKQGARIGHLKLVILARLSQRPVNEWHNSLLVLRFWNENIKCLVFGCRQKIPTIKSKQKNLLLCRLLLIDLEWIEWLQENLRYKSHDLLPVFLPLETLLLCVFLNEKMQASKIHCWLIEITHDICKFFLHLQLLIRLFRFRSRYERYTQLTRRFLRSFIQVVSMSFSFFGTFCGNFFLKDRLRRNKTTFRSATQQFFVSSRNAQHKEWLWLCGRLCQVYVTVLKLNFDWMPL